MLDLRLAQDGELSGTVGRAGQDSYGAFNARQATAQEARMLDAFAAQQLAVDDRSCAAAKRCFVLACPAFGVPKDPCVFEQQSMSHDGQSCRAFLPMLEAELKQLDKDVPSECVPQQ
jgi:hypothetical protein